MATMTLDYDKATIRVEADSPFELQFRLQVSRKEPWTVQWIEGMQPGDVLYDLGASTGPYSLIAAKRGIRVYAFEPAFASYARLCGNTWLNSLHGLLTPLPLAISSRTGLASITYSDTRPGAACHTFTAEVGSSSRAPGHYTQLVPAFALDDLLHYDPTMPPPNYLKVDVDGAEPEVLAGAHAVLALPSFRSAMVEAHLETEHNLLAAAREAGLRSAQRFDPALADWPRDDVVYHLFERAP